MDDARRPPRAPASPGAAHADGLARPGRRLVVRPRGLPRLVGQGDDVDLPAVSDTFIFGCFLTGYMTVRASTTVPWPNPSEVFALHVGGADVPLLLIAIMTFVLITQQRHDGDGGQLRLPRATASTPPR